METARRYGIDVNKSVRYHNDAKGVAMNYRVMERAIRMVRSDMVLDSGWKEDAEDDFEKRKK